MRRNRKTMTNDSHLALAVREQSDVYEAIYESTYKITANERATCRRL
jgi:hypothetical protein